MLAEDEDEYFSVLSRGLKILYALEGDGSLAEKASPTSDLLIISFLLFASYFMCSHR